MKKTKEIAELFFSEMDRVAKGEIRKDVIVALSQCTDSLVKLARLEMDYAVQNWASNKPEIPWLNSSAETKQLSAPPATAKAEFKPQSKIVKGQQIEKQLFDAREQLKSATGTMRTILTDKIKHFESSLGRAELSEFVDKE